MSFDEELKEALRRKEPPAGFTERVLAALKRTEVQTEDQTEDQTPDRRGRLSYTWRAVAAAALLVAIAGGGVTARYIEGQRAKRDVLLALHITGAKLRDARNHVHEISTR
jgi:hypothetical protein